MRRPGSREAAALRDVRPAVRPRPSAGERPVARDRPRRTTSSRGAGVGQTRRRGRVETRPSRSVPGSGDPIAPEPHLAQWRAALPGRRRGTSPARDRPAARDRPRRTTSSGGAGVGRTRRRGRVETRPSRRFPADAPSFRASSTFRRRATLRVPPPAARARRRGSAPAKPRRGEAGTPRDTKRTGQRPTARRSARTDGACANRCPGSEQARDGTPRIPSATVTRPRHAIRPRPSAGDRPVARHRPGTTTHLGVPASGRPAAGAAWKRGPPDPSRARAIHRAGTTHRAMEGGPPGPPSWDIPGPRPSRRPRSPPPDSVVPGCRRRADPTTAGPAPASGIATTPRSPNRGCR